MVLKLASIAITLALVSACQPAIPTNVKQTIVYGQAVGAPNIVTGEAVQAARLAINTAAASGCRAISIGSGHGVGGEGLGAAANVVVLLECPTTTPDIIAATGAPVTP